MLAIGGLPSGLWYRNVCTHVAAAHAECNCRCAAAANCTGYTWLAENSTCWLHRFVQTFVDPEPDSNPGTTLGRVITGKEHSSMARLP